MNIFEWIERELEPEIYNSVEFMYDDMDSQSDYCLPIIYKVFDANDRLHWRDRGSCFDFLFATDGAGKRLLDFGPGDGWPSLIVAPFTGEVTGIEGSLRRTEVCTANAERLGISNTHFIYVKPGENLPFENNTFDGVMAASSIEQTPDPEFTLKELYRVLKTGGRLRMDYESLGFYSDGREQEVHLDKINDHSCVLTLYDRHVNEELAKMYKIFFSISKDEIKGHFSRKESSISIDDFTLERLEKTRYAISETRMCVLTHPSGKTFVVWLKNIGFKELNPTHSGAWFAGQLFDQLPKKNQPKTMAGVDELLRPIVKIVVQMKAQLGTPRTWDPMITAVK